MREPLETRKVRHTLRFRRHQRGSLYKRGTRIKWYGMWREDVRLPNGSIQRRQRNICLGPMSELRTRSAAFVRLAECMKLKAEKPSMELTFEDLVERWKAVVVPTLKTSTASYYLKILRSNVVPASGKARYVCNRSVRCGMLPGRASAAEHTKHAMRNPIGWLA
jgi:hypothetical protein